MDISTSNSTGNLQKFGQMSSVQSTDSDGDHDKGGSGKDEANSPGVSGSAPFNLKISQSALIRVESSSKAVEAEKPENNFNAAKVAAEQKQAQQSSEEQSSGEDKGASVNTLV